MGNLTSTFKIVSKRSLSKAKNSKPSRFLPGFTIVELVVVIVVIAILASISIVAYNTAQANARDKSVLADINSLDALETQYALKNNTAGLSWYSGNGVNTTLNYNPSNGDVVDIVTNTTDYCIRAYNPSAATYNSITNAATTGSSSTACSSIPPSSSATGTLTCPTNFIIVPGNSLFSTSDFCVMKYEASQASSTVPASAVAAPWVNISQSTALTYSQNVASCSGCHLITENEWLTIAANLMSVASNWSGGAVGSGTLYVGHTDNAPSNVLVPSSNDANGYYGETNTGGNQRRTMTLTNGNVIWDFSGNTNTWTQGILPQGQTLSGGTGWLDYNDPTWSQTGLPSKVFPVYANPAAANWTGAGQGIGQLNGSTNTDGDHVYMRGCYYGADNDVANHCGLYILYLRLNNTASSAGEGFRVTK